MLKDKPPSSGTCKLELGTHLLHSDLEVNRVAAPSEIGFSADEGVGETFQVWDRSVLCGSCVWTFKNTSGRGFSHGVGGDKNQGHICKKATPECLPTWKVHKSFGGADLLLEVEFSHFT